MATLGWGVLLKLLLPFSSFKETLLFLLPNPHNPRLSECYRLKSTLTKYAFNYILFRQLLYK